MLFDCIYLGTQLVILHTVGIWVGLTAWASSLERQIIVPGEGSK